MRQVSTHPTPYVCKIDMSRIMKLLCVGWGALRYRDVNIAFFTRLYRLPYLPYPSICCFGSFIIDPCASAR